MSVSTFPCDSIQNTNSFAYHTLANYNTPTGREVGSPPVPAGVVSGGFVVPDVGNITHDTLTAQNGLANGGYFTMRGAYGPGADKCITNFMHVSCAP
jgi:hypothetical protein